VKLQDRATTTSRGALYRRANRIQRVRDMYRRGFTCDICSRVCASRIGLTSHQRIHLWSIIQRSTAQSNDRRTTSYQRRN